MPDKDLVCSLTAADYRDREKAWLKLGNFARASAAIAGGLRFTFASIPGVGDSLKELVRLEAECCSWMTFTMRESPEVISLSITSDNEAGERGVRETFAPLIRRVG